MIACVVAHSRNRVIGRDGDLPWRLPTDMKFFRELTTGHTVLMGRRTYESIPERFRPLPERRNLVLTHRTDYAPPGAEVFHELASALASCTGDCFVIGGGTVYAETLAHTDRVYSTDVEAELEGDTYFPALSPEECVVDESAPVSENGFSYRFRTYDRA